MANHPHVDLSESSIYGKDREETDRDSPAELTTDAAIERLEAIRSGSEDRTELYVGKMGEMVDELDASTEEELDALRVNLLQDDARANTQDGSGRIVDDVAEEQLAELTEVGPDLTDEGALPVAPGRENTSAVLRRHHPETARAEAVVEGNVEETRNEIRGDVHVDEGTAG